MKIYTLCLVALFFFGKAAIGEIAEMSTFVADGAPVAVESKGMVITPAAGWEVQRNFPGTTLLMQAPKDDHPTYRRTIQVMSFPGSAYIDEMGASEFADTIVKNFSKASAKITNYKIRNYLPVDLESGVPGYLFYTEFKLEDSDMMQMHVLVSSGERHMVITFTDLAEFFEGGGESDDHLNEAWQIIGSVELSSSGPSRFGLPGVMLGLVFFTLGFGWIYLRIRAKKAEKRYRQFADTPEEDDEAVTMSPESIHSKQSLGTLHEGTLHEEELDSGKELGFEDDKAG